MQMYVIPEDALVSLIEHIKRAPNGCGMSGMEQEVYLNQVRAGVIPVPPSLDIKALIETHNIVQGSATDVPE